MKTSRIPARFLAPIVREYLETYEMEAEMQERPDRRVRACVRALALEADLNPTYVQNLVDRPHKTVKFDAADRLLCAMDKPQAWLEWPLIAFYYATSLSERTRGRHLELVA